MQALICPLCDVEMLIGETISAYTHKRALESFQPVYTFESVKLDIPILIKCWKCPSCGNSEEIDSRFK